MSDTGTYRFVPHLPYDEYSVEIEHLVLHSNEELCIGAVELRPGEVRVLRKGYVVKKRQHRQWVELCHNERRDFVKID